ncbi:hypothetical protein [Flavobacterium reichenbachii]|uniref:Uncharacterized protein n=1 Tax=Flavobacterium reichenbachii TaxID=362418 RepID=A0A085ZNU9_9FLAO|nr:hypothetical protein [Flavobacterium reichenbachii]KFF06113.1 hypothetical protein IW19_11490 [Flavobacterium reichenbachii]OXB14664.1 hypothetical protein B0A68_11455 [Flavobacterium reichenbachii]
MENCKPKIYNSYDSHILEALFLKYGVSKYYIRKCLAGNAQGIKPDSIKKDYLIMEKKIKETISKLIE